ncbi:hypothetical protein C1645_735605 [Glomus cerebriforme]|uniref:Uncharacterized protein n=1 Tax=Glomus cerebriforme TaxID=658196 RepID=A0A397T582_9GLOM|nr:hypothetical protein C1645_735605 [Glomus cerebriforme]
MVVIEELKNDRKTTEDINPANLDISEPETLKILKGNYQLKFEVEVNEEAKRKQNQQKAQLRRDRKSVMVGRSAGLGFQDYYGSKWKMAFSRVCKAPGCYNNYADIINHDPSEETRVENGRCGYHRRKESGEVEINSNDGVLEIINQARNTYENSNNLVEINQAISDLENIKNDQGNESSGDTGNNGESSETTPSGNTTTSLQTIKNNAIQEIKTALVSPEPALADTDLSQDNRN